MKRLSLIGFPRVLAGLDLAERKTFRLHLAYQSIEGIILGILALNEFVFLKSIKGSSYEVGVLFQFSMIVFIFLVLFNELRKRVKNRKLMLNWTGIATRLPLAGLFFFPSEPSAYISSQVYHYIFLFIFLVYYLGNIIIYPAINVMLKTNYRHENFGKLYAYSTSVNKMIMLVATFLYGAILDFDFYAFRYVFPLIAALGIISIFILSGIDLSTPVVRKQVYSVWKSVKLSVSRMYRIVKDNKPYRDFELGFMGYGFAFMMTSPVINIFLNEGLELNYSSVAFYKNAYNIIAIILLLFTGRWLGRMDPRKFAAYTFISLGGYIFFMMLSQYFQASFYLGNIRIYYSLILSFLSYGYFAATMVLLWNIGSAYFCRPEEADDYQSNHLFLTGVRSILAPILGVFFYETIGFTWTFIIGVLFSVISAAIMLVSYKNYKFKPGEY
jgi:MFS family permease